MYYCVYFCCRFLSLIFWRYMTQKKLILLCKCQHFSLNKKKYMIAKPSRLLWELLPSVQFLTLIFAQLVQMYISIFHSLQKLLSLTLIKQFILFSITYHCSTDVCPARRRRCAHRSESAGEKRNWQRRSCSHHILAHGRKRKRT